MPSRKDKGYAWVILAASFVLHLLCGVILSTFGIYFVELTDSYVVSKFYVGILGGIQTGITVSAPLLSPLVQKYGCRPLCCVGGALMSFGFILSSQTPNFDFLFFSFGLTSGLGYVIIQLVSSVAPQQWFQSRRALASGVSRSGFAAAYFFWPPLVRYLIDKYSWKGSLLIQGGISLNCIVCAVLLQSFPETGSKTREGIPLRDEVLMEEILCNKDQILASIENDNTACSFTRISQKVHKYTGCGRGTVLCDALVSIGCLLAFSSHVTILAMVPLRAESLGISKTRVSFMYSMFGAVSGTFRIVFGFLGDAPCVNRTLLAFMGLSLVGVCSVISVYLHSFVGQCIFTAIFGVTSAMHHGNWPAVFVDVLGAHRVEFSMGLFLWCLAIGGLISLPLAGFLVDVTLNPNTPFTTFGIISIVAGLFTVSVYFIARFTTKNLNERNQ